MTTRKNWKMMTTKTPLSKEVNIKSCIFLMSVYKGRPCGPHKSAKNPTAYQREELIDKVAKKFDIPKKSLSKTKKEDLCASLIQNKLTSNIKSKKVKSPKAKLALKKKVTPKTKIHVSPKPKIVKKKKSPKTKVSPPKPSSPKKVAVKKTKKALPLGECVARSKMRLHPHQVRVVEYMKRHRGLIVAWKVGSGKTLVAVTVSQCFLDANPKGKVLAIIPLSLQQNFKDTMTKYGADPEDPRYEILTMQKFSNLYKRKTCSSDTLVIVDEAHVARTTIKGGKIKKSTGKPTKRSGLRTDVLLRCTQHAAKVLLLTGTPVYNAPQDISNLAAMIKGKAALTDGEFTNLLSHSADFKRYFECTASFFEGSREDGMWPSIEEHYIEIPMTQSYYKEYKKVEDKKSPYFTTKNPWSFLIGMRQATNVITECPKCEWTLKKVQEGQKTVVYSSFLSKGIEEMKKALKKNNIKFAEITGKMSKKDRDASVASYNGNKVKVLLISRAGGEGLDLQGTRNVVLFEKAWNRPSEEQVIGRARRFGSHSHLPLKERHVNVYHLLTVKPRGNKDKHASADAMLKKVIEDKEHDNRRFINKLTPLSIENSKCS
jgi:SNF2 family DNA or RNA helicase